MESLVYLPLADELKKSLSQFVLPEELGFGSVMAPIMAQAKCLDGEWSAPEIVKYGPLSFDPSAKILHYAQQSFEGIKAFFVSDSQANIFRPDRNWQRMNKSGERMQMPAIPKDVFSTSLNSMVKHSFDLIPKGDGESLYLRPLMLAMDKGLGLGCSREFLFLIMASPSGAFFSSSQVSVLIERNHCRAAKGGTGSAKVAGNYGASIASSIKAKRLSYHQTLWLDASQKKYMEELSGMNIFMVINGDLYTPDLTDSILAGVTRESILHLAELMGIKTFEQPLDVDWAIDKIKRKECTEFFACGTAAVITPVSELGEESGIRYEVGTGLGPVAEKLRAELVAIQKASVTGPDGWNVLINRDSI